VGKIIFPPKPTGEDDNNDGDQNEKKLFYKKSFLQNLIW
jgi:hypothetical protein